MGSKDKQSKKLRNEEASKYIKNMQSQKKKEKEQQKKRQQEKLSRQKQKEQQEEQARIEKNRKKREKKIERMIRKQQKQNREEEMKQHNIALQVSKIVRTKEEERKEFLEGLTPHERRRAIQENEEILKQAYTKEVYKILPKSHPNLGMYEENEDKQELDNSAGIVLGD